MLILHEAAEKLNREIYFQLILAASAIILFSSQFKYSDRKIDAL